MVPAVLWWLLLLALSEPDEGANIGGDILGVAVIAASSIAALAFVGEEARVDALQALGAELDEADDEHPMFQ